MCDTWVALADATRTQQVIFAKNSDRPIFDCQPLVRYPAQDWPANSQIQLEYRQIPQVPRTYANLGSSPYWSWGYEEGINEHGVVIGNEAIYTRTFSQLAAAYQTGEAIELGLVGMDLIRLGLERGATAAQAVEVMGQLIEQYGQFGSGVPTQSHIEGGYDNSFIIADPTEAYVLEALGTRWAARRITTGYTAISNQMTIRQQWDLGSEDLEAFARQSGWPVDEPFDLARAYIDEGKPRQLSHIRLMRSQQLLEQRSGDITPEWMMRIARDHYEDSFLQGPYFDAADPDFLSICMHVSPADFTWGNTASSCVAPLPTSGQDLPYFLWTPGPPCNGCYVPFFVHSSQLPPTVSQAGVAGKQVRTPPDAPADHYAANAYWWRFRQLMDRVKGDSIRSIPGLYAERNAIVRERFDALEADFMKQLPAVMLQATADESLNPNILDVFTDDCVHRVLAAVDSLLDQFGEPAI